ncbi:ABC transporter ATP-binding protein [Verrucosispora sp. TAA-831]|uniref:ABC transporter ATP-binding protein n=1 Tax=Verrucosispora sp. TAA-831 TaxID=3422227 RepID=UPI003D700B9F
MIRVDGLGAVADGHRLLRDVSFTVPSGGVLAVVGPSGSGKSTLGRALLGEVGPGVRLTGRVEIDGRVVGPGTPAPGGLVGYVPQQPSAALTPVRRIGPVLHEIARRHRPVPGRRARRAAVREAVRAVLTRVGLPADAEALRRYPHQFSGGQQQRLVVAHALLAGARVLVADEPTTGQDGLHRRDVAAELRRLAATGVTVVLLSHDLHLVRAIADDAIVLDRGVVVAAGPAHTVVGEPTRSAPAARPDAGSPSTDALLRAEALTAAALLRAEGLTAAHRGGTVLHGVDVTLGDAQCLALIGRSGSGKTTLARCLAGLHRPDTGTVTLDGRRLAASLDRRDPADLAAVQYVFQDPRASFHPYAPVLAQVTRPAVRLRRQGPADVLAAARALLDQVGLDRDLVTRRPDRLSGGELQRAALVRALLTRPRLLVCDEITSGLDGVNRDRILSLLDELRQAHRLALLVITHDPEVVVRLADRVVVLDHGRVVEHGRAAELPAGARSTLTRALLDPTIALPATTPDTEEMSRT